MNNDGAGSASSCIERLAAAGIELPEPFPSFGSYIMCKRWGSQLFTAGHVSAAGDQFITGKLGASLDVEAGRARRHHLDGAAREPHRDGPHRRLAGQPDDVADRAQCEAGSLLLDTASHVRLPQSQFRAPRRHS